MRHVTQPPRSGFTLAELIVVLAVIAMLSIVAGVAAPPFTHAKTQSTLQRTIADARARALRSGHPVEDSVIVAGTSHRIRALPDGGILSDSVLGLMLADRLAP